MARFWLIIGLLFVPALLYAQEERTNYSEGKSSDSTRVYLLRTGYLLEGTAAENGKNYILQSHFGSMSVPIQSVEFIGKTKLDVYHYKRSNSSPADANALLKLAEWCLNNGLVQEGMIEYQRAGQVAPNAAFRDLIRQRLELLQQPAATESKTGTNMPASNKTVPVSKTVLDSFIRNVQPLLVNRCAAADCHGTHSPQQLKIGIPREPMGTTTTRNLQAILPYLNLEYPTESPILSAMVTPHGGVKPILNVESNHYVNAVQWIQQAAKELPLDRQETERSVSDGNTAAPIAPLKAAFLPEQLRQAIPKTDRLPNVQPTTFDSSDPLDPDPFNTKFHRQEPKR